MTRTEAFQLLRQLCPVIADARGAKGRAIATLESLCGDRGFRIGMCNESGDWVVLNKNGTEVARCA